jgi:hypothetical protein
MILPAVSARPPILLAVMSELRRLPLSTLIAVTWRLKLARLFLWLARVTDRYEGVDMRTSRRIVESAEQCARKSDRLRRRLRPRLTTAPRLCETLISGSETISASRLAGRLGNP